jgi:hypothetical protein
MKLEEISAELEAAFARDDYVDVVNVWTKGTQSGDVDLIRPFHAAFGMRVVDVVQAARDETKHAVSKYDTAGLALLHAYVTRDPSKDA